MENGFVGFTQEVIEGSVRRCCGFIVAEGYDANRTCLVDSAFYIPRCAVGFVMSVIDGWIIDGLCTRLQYDSMWHVTYTAGAQWGNSLEGIMGMQIDRAEGAQEQCLRGL